MVFEEKNWLRVSKEFIHDDVLRWARKELRSLGKTPKEMIVFWHMTPKDLDNMWHQIFKFIDEKPKYRVGFEYWGAKHYLAPEDKSYSASIYFE